MPSDGEATLRLTLRRRVPVILQAETTECGLACLAMVAAYHGLELDLNTLRGKFQPSLRGTALPQLMKIGSELRLSSRALRLELSALSQLSLPSILHWNFDHFVVLERVGSGHAWIVDPAVGRRKVTWSELSKQFTGVALELAPAENFEQAKVQAAIALSSFFRGVTGLPTTLAKLLAISAMLQILVLLVPFYSQLIIDDVLMSRDYDLLTLLLFGFSVIVALQMSVSALRSFFVLHFGSRLQFAWATRLFHHLLRLPLAYYEKRHMADVLSRFRSLNVVQGLVTTAIVEALIDGAMAITTFAVMVLYSPLLTLVPVTALVAYAGARALSYGPQRSNAQEALVQSAKENSHFLESLRGILAIKSFAREQTREATWQNRAADSIRASYKASMFTTAQQLANQALFGFESLLVLWLGARAVMAGDLTVGMLMAFAAYKGQFTSRAAALIDKAMEFRLTSVHLDRLADIALTQEEDGLQVDASPIPAIEGRITADRVSFRHSPSDPFVLSNVSLTVGTGECVAIMGPSGCGKTTLLKVMMGLLRPEAGQVTVDGRDIFRSSVRDYRKQIAAVMQEDTLLSGTLADNIAFFDSAPDRERIEYCARVACIHEEIQRMPMGYLTLVGDMGAALSGGQKQRVLLARALYGSPKLLFLDEATSHLDPETEQRVHRAIGELRITRIIVAHRRETLTIADRVIQLGDAVAKPDLVRKPTLVSDVGMGVASTRSIAQAGEAHVFK